MARVYSDLYNDITKTGYDQATSYDSQFRAPRGLGHAVQRVAVAKFRFEIGDTLAIGDELRIKSFKAGDRITAIGMWRDDPGATGIFNLGLYEAGQDNDGVEAVAAASDDLFASVHSIAGAAVTYANRILVDLWNEAGHFDDFDRYKKLWELVNIQTASTYASDADGGDLDLVATMTAVTDGAAKFEMCFEIHYTSDGN